MDVAGLTLGLIMSGTVAAGCEQLAIDTSQGTVRDNSSGLIWSRCLLGQAASGCLGAGATLSWVDALHKARGAEPGGTGSWRLPNIQDLKKLFATGPTCVAQAFPGTGTSIVWSASANHDYAADAWAFNFGTGQALLNSKDSKLQVLLVASPK